MKTASYISGVGCNATAANLALLPAAQSRACSTSRSRSSLISRSARPKPAHRPTPARTTPSAVSVIRTFSAYGHRHTAEVIQELGLDNVHLTMTSVDLVRGALAAAHAFVKPGVAEKDLWSAYRGWAETEPFVRLVKDKRGIYRVPEPKILAGTNYADVGFELDPDSGRVVCHGRHRQPDERRGRLRRPGHEPDVRLRRNRRSGISAACIRFRAISQSIGNRSIVIS